MLKQITTFVFQCDSWNCRMAVRAEVIHGIHNPPTPPKPPEGWRVVHQDIDGVVRANPWHYCPTCQTLDRIKAANASEAAVPEVKPCWACRGLKGNFEPAVAHTDVWYNCDVCKGTGVEP